MLLSMLKKYKYRGIAMVEYAVLLAFVCIVAATFIDNHGINAGIKNIVKNVNKYFLTFEEMYPSNTSEVYSNFGDLFRAAHDKDKEADRDENNNRPKDYLKTVFDKLTNNSEIQFADLNYDQVAALAKVGLNVEKFPNGVFYKDNAGRWYATWTGEDLSKKNEGEKVKVITYSLSGGAGGADKAGFYVGETVYQNGSISNNRIRYDTANGMSPKTNSSSTYKYYANSSDAQAAYDALTPQ